MLEIFGATIAQMVVVVAVVWLVYQTHAWWAYLLWYLLILLLSICWVLYPLQALWKKMLRPVGTAILVGSVVVGGSTILCLPISVFMTVYSVLMACLTASLPTCYRAWWRWRCFRAGTLTRCSPVHYGNQQCWIIMYFASEKNFRQTATIRIFCIIYV